MAAFAVVMCVMLIAARQSPSEVGGVSVPPSADSDRETQPSIVVDDVLPSLRTLVTGVRELEIRGYVRNDGKQAVKSADLRCHFQTYSGAEKIYELPLVVDSHLDEVGDGPLMSMERREFGVRIGEFPDTVDPEITKIEVINARFLELR